ncbi:hypothetical protein SSS_06846 [Sarcoptes scabiei]|uniref:Uncharacterized protein n=1 Tax=Sarcoptes scabiei TaxID=52283 RepID=A0A834VDH4_SARSC|nr:hypothetical protein SSS_06846 [Sarcoptes scabiei]
MPSFSTAKSSTATKSSISTDSPNETKLNHQNNSDVHNEGLIYSSGIEEAEPDYSDDGDDDGDQKDHNDNGGKDSKEIRENSPKLLCCGNFRSLDHHQPNQSHQIISTKNENSLNYALYNSSHQHQYHHRNDDHHQHHHDHHNRCRLQHHQDISDDDDSIDRQQTNSVLNKEYNRKLLISLGMLLPAIATIIGVMAWAISAEVVLGAKREASRRMGEIGYLKLSNRHNYSRFDSLSSPLILSPEDMLIASARKHQPSKHHQHQQSYAFFSPSFSSVSSSLPSSSMEIDPFQNTQLNLETISKEFSNRRMDNDEDVLDENENQKLTKMRTEIQNRLSNENLSKLLAKLFQNYQNGIENHQKNDVGKPQIIVVAPSSSLAASQASLKNDSNELIQVSKSKPKAFAMKLSMNDQNQNKKSSPSKSSSQTSSSSKQKDGDQPLKNNRSSSKQSSKQLPSSSLNKRQKQSNHQQTEEKIRSSKNQPKSKLYEKEIDKLLQKIERLERQKLVQKSSPQSSSSIEDILKKKSSTLAGKSNPISEKIKKFMESEPLPPTEKTQPESESIDDSNNPTDQPQMWLPPPLPPPPPMSLIPPMPYMPFMPPIALNNPTDPTMMFQQPESVQSPPPISNEPDKTIDYEQAIRPDYNQHQSYVQQPPHYQHSLETPMVDNTNGYQLDQYQSPYLQQQPASMPQQPYGQAAMMSYPEQQHHQSPPQPQQPYYDHEPAESVQVSNEMNSFDYPPYAVSHSAEMPYKNLEYEGGHARPPKEEKPSKSGLFGRRFQLGKLFRSKAKKSKKSELKIPKQYHHKQRPPMNGSPTEHMENIDPMMLQESQYQQLSSLDRRYKVPRPKGHHYPMESAGVQLRFGGGPLGGGSQVKVNPMAILKTIALPLMRKPAMNLNGKVVFGVVLENGIGHGRKPKTVFQHYSTGRIKK